MSNGIHPEIYNVTDIPEARERIRREEGVTETTEREGKRVRREVRRAVWGDGVCALVVHYHDIARASSDLTSGQPLLSLSLSL